MGCVGSSCILGCFSQKEGFFSFSWYNPQGPPRAGYHGREESTAACTRHGSNYEELKIAFPAPMLLNFCILNCLTFVVVDGVWRLNIICSSRCEWSHSGLNTLLHMVWLCTRGQELWLSISKIKICFNWHIESIVYKNSHYENEIKSAKGHYYVMKYIRPSQKKDRKRLEKRWLLSGLNLLKSSTSCKQTHSWGVKRKSPMYL